MFKHVQKLLDLLGKELGLFMVWFEFMKSSKPVIGLNLILWLVLSYPIGQLVSNISNRNERFGLWVLHGSYLMLEILATFFINTYI